MRLTTRRTVGLVALAIVIAALVTSTGSHGPKLAALEVRSELVPRMRAIDEARATCTPNVARRQCTAADIAATPAGRSIGLRVADACVAPDSACITSTGDVLTVRIVSGPLPTIGGVRLDGRAQRLDPRIHWTCTPTHGTERDAPALVHRACGDVPRG